MNFITMRHFFICLFTFSFLINFAQSRAKFTDKFKVVSGGYYHNVLENYGLNGLNGLYDPEPIYFNDKDTTLFTQISSSEDTISIFIGTQEISNAEYALFEHWVFDSISRMNFFLADLSNNGANSKWGYYVNYPTRLKDSSGYYKLNWKTPLPFYKSALNYLEELIHLSGETSWKNHLKESNDTLLYCFQNEYEKLDIKRTIPKPIEEYFFYHDGDQSNGIEFIKHSTPVVGVSFNQAEAYCDWLNWVFQAYYDNLSRRDKKQFPKTTIFRLPSASEWQRAAFLNQSMFTTLLQNGYGRYRANYGSVISDKGMEIKKMESDGYYRTAPIDAYGAWYGGLYNMYGNASEWTTTFPNMPSMKVSRLNSTLPLPFTQEEVETNYPWRRFKDSIFIEDPTMNKIFLVKPFSKEHEEILIKRSDFFQINITDTKEEILSKFIGFNSINEVLLSEEKLKKKIKIDEAEEVLVNDDFSNKVKIYDNFKGEYTYINLDRVLNTIDRFIHDVNVLKKASDFDLNKTRIVKGGSWNSSINFLDFRANEVYHEESKDTQIGFRVVGEIRK